MTHKIQWSTRSERDLSKLRRADLRRRIIAAVNSLADVPRPPGCKRMIGYPDGVMRLRVGDYRIIYQVVDDQVKVFVIRVARRREAYR